MTLTATVDTGPVRQAFDALLADMRDRTKAASLTSANGIVRESQARVARRTGDTSRGIHAEETYDGTGYVVLVTREVRRQLPYWLEFGTQYMTKRPFLFASAALEEGPHADRIADAVQTSITASGFGG
jgi:hypothetical protein